MFPSVLEVVWREGVSGLPCCLQYANEKMREGEEERERRKEVEEVGREGEGK